MPLPLNTLMTAGGGLSGVRFDPFMSYNFLIEIDMLITGGFTEVQGLDSQIELEEYQEGGTYGYTHKFPKRVNSSNLILTKGLTVFPTLWNWYEDAM
ncbi:MAG: phage tail protein, partial [Cyanobacteria bacterium J06649_11]